MAPWEGELVEGDLLYVRGAKRQRHARYTAMSTSDFEEMSYLEEVLSSDELSLVHYVSGVKDKRRSNDDDISDISVDTEYAEDFESQDFGVNKSQETEAVDVTSDRNREEEEEDFSFSEDDNYSVTEKEEIIREHIRERKRLMVHMKIEERIEYMVRQVIEEMVPAALVIEESKIENEELLKLWQLILTSREMTLAVPKIIDSTDCISYEGILKMSGFEVMSQEDKRLIIVLLLVGVISFMPRNNVVFRRLRCRLGRHRAKLSDRIGQGREDLSLLTLLEPGEKCPSLKIDSCFY